MPVQIQLRRGTAAEWTAADPTLAEGEAGVETDTGQFKVGDGATAWTSLPYSVGNLADQGIFTYLDGTVAGAPGTPGSGKLRIYAKTGKVLAVKDDAGVETELGAGGAVADILDLPTAEDDDSLVLAPDGVGGVEFRAETGGGGGAPTTAPYVTTAADAGLSAEVVRPHLGNYFHETKPDSPNATYDDEFDDTTGMSGTNNGLDARWNWRNQGTATATFTKAGWLTLNIPASGQVNWRIIEIAAYADGTYEAKISMDTSVEIGDTAGGVVIIDSVNGDFYLLGLTADGSGTTRYIGVQKWTNVTTWSANTKRTSIPLGQTLVFVRVVRASAATQVWFSDDGIGWVKYYAWNEDVVATRIGLGLNEKSNDGVTKLHVDYFRKVA